MTNGSLDRPGRFGEINKYLNERPTEFFRRRRRGRGVQ